MVRKDVINRLVGKFRGLFLKRNYYYYYYCIRKSFKLLNSHYIFFVLASEGKRRKEFKIPLGFISIEIIVGLLLLLMTNCFCSQLGEELNLNRILFRNVVVWDGE